MKSLRNAVALLAEGDRLTFGRHEYVVVLNEEGRVTLQSYDRVPSGDAGYDERQHTYDELVDLLEDSDGFSVDRHDRVYECSECSCELTFDECVVTTDPYDGYSYVLCHQCVGDIKG